ncbi:MAG TPA: M28 family metallopeptidase, partial [Vicinamibacteria bacterium]
AVLNNDIVGNPAGGNGIVDAESVRVFSEGPEDSPSRQLARFIARQAARYYPSHQVRLMARHDRFGRGGDHSAFNQYGFAAVRFSESNENYARQHAAEDTLEGVNPAYLARNARVNAAALAGIALAPPAPKTADEQKRPLLDRQPSGYDARLRWAAAPGAAGYRIFWREAWTPDWQHELAVGNVTEFVLRDVSIDDYVFGVAAVGPEGHESLVSAWVNPPRREVEIKRR